MQGILIVDKPMEWTSFDVIAKLRGILRERGFSPNEIEAVVAQNPDRLDDIVQRLEAVKAFAALPEAASLAAANKRITSTSSINWINRFSCYKLLFVVMND